MPQAWLGYRFHKRLAERELLYQCLACPVEIDSSLMWRLAECRYAPLRTGTGMLVRKRVHDSQQPQPEIQSWVIESLDLVLGTMVRECEKSKLN